MPTRIILVDDHVMLRAGIKGILEICPDSVVVAEAGSGIDCLRLCQQDQPDLVIMDIGLPDLSGIETTLELRRRHPAIRVLILSMYDDHQTVLSAIQAGARGFVLKKASDSAGLLEAIRTVAAGGFYLSPQIADALLFRIQQGDSPAAAQSPLEQLSDRERQVLRLVAEGKTSKEVALLLDLSPKTIRTYRKTLIAKLRVHNVAALTKLALATGLVHHARLVTDPQPKRPSS